MIANVMHKFLIYFSIYFCLTCFRLSFGPSSEAGVHLQLMLVIIQLGTNVWEQLIILSSVFNHAPSSKSM
jgi:hypothetical protein